MVLWLDSAFIIEDFTFVCISVDERCDMELDETDPTVWKKLEAATKDYIQNNSSAMKSVCERLLQNQHEEKLSEYLKSQHLPNGKASNAGTSAKVLYQLAISFALSDVLCIIPNFTFDYFWSLAALKENVPSLGWRRSVLLVEASHSLDSGRVFHHARSLETFCSQTGIRFSLMNGVSGTIKAVPGTTFPTPFASPLFTGSFPSTPILYSPDIGPHRIGRIDLVPPLSLDGSQSAKTAASPPESPPVTKQLSVPVKSLHEKLQNSPQVGIVHLALQNDTCGSILRLNFPSLVPLLCCFHM